MFLAGDIGGTRSRFYAIEGNKVVFEKIYSSKEHPDFISIVKKWTEDSKLTFSSCVFGIAGAVHDGKCKTTNLPWEVCIADIKKALGVKEGFLVNDLQLLSYGIVDLHQDKLESIQMGEKRKGPMLIICPGTGFGIAAVIQTGHPLEIISTEAGHVDFAPTTKEQIHLLEYFMKKYPHVSYERFVSGSGLLNIYEFLCIEKNLKMNLHAPEDITKAAIDKSDTLAQHACQLFFDILASSAGNFALSYLPFEGVYLCGGIMRTMYPLLDKKRFADNFTAKGRFNNLLSKIPLMHVKEVGLASLGAIRFYQNLKELSCGK